MIKSIIVIAFLVASTVSVDLPPFVTPCKIKDPSFSECSTKEANKVIQILAPGIKEAGFPSLKPYEIQEHLYTNDKVKIKFIGGVLEGIDTMTVNNITSDLDGKRFDLYATIKTLKLHSAYVVQGKLLDEELKASGPVHITLEDVNYDYHNFYDVIKKEDGLEYMKVLTHSLILRAAKGHFQFGNVFDDKEKTSKFNEALNSKIDVANAEVVPAVTKIVYYIKDLHVIKNLAEIVPFNQLFP